MVLIAEEFEKHCSLPLIIQSNAGLPKLINGEAEYSETPDFMAEKIKYLISSGAAIIGGCCGTTPEYIREFRKVISKIN